MGDKTNIEWCDSTVNPSSGCDGCELWNEVMRTCYAGNLHETRLYPSFKDTRPELYAPTFSEVRLIPGRMAQAADWRDLRGKDRPKKPWLNGLPRIIFVGDLGDFMSRAVTDDYFKSEIIGNITSKQGSRHFWMLLTKRPRRLAELSEALGGLPDNVMALTTVTTQKTADLRIPELLKVRCKWRGISAEPLLERIDFSKINNPERVDVDLLIAGGESGKGARPCNVEWLRSLRDQAKASGTAFFLKQLGSHIINGLSKPPIPPPWPDGAQFDACGRVFLKHVKGGNMNEWPEDLKNERQFPKV